MCFRRCTRKKFITSRKLFIWASFTTTSDACKHACTYLNLRTVIGLIFDHQPTEIDAEARGARMSSESFSSVYLVVMKNFRIVMKIIPGHCGDASAAHRTHAAQRALVCLRATTGGGAVVAVHDAAAAAPWLSLWLLWGSRMHGCLHA